ncbi:MAG: DUF5615 family PIN-like protein [Phycisphaerales bacterium]|jgi:predicted nuclease of predicted toxin-antitoxin system
MTPACIWIDMNLPMAMAAWLGEAAGIPCHHVFDLGYGEADDRTIYAKAREAGAALFTKDSDFADLVRRQGPPPQVAWILFGNTSNRRLRTGLLPLVPRVMQALRSGEALVEVHGPESR